LLVPLSTQHFTVNYKATTNDLKTDIEEIAKNFHHYEKGSKQKRLYIPR